MINNGINQANSLTHGKNRSLQNSLNTLSNVMIQYGYGLPQRSHIDLDFQQYTPFFIR